MQAIWKTFAAIVFTIIARLACAGEPVVDKVPPPQPYIFDITGLNPDQVEDIKRVPGVQNATAIRDKTQVVFQPWNDNPWAMADQGKPKWIKGAERFYDFVAIKIPLGKTKWTHGGVIAHNAGAIIWYGPTLSGSKGAPIVFGIMFDDLKRGKNEILRIACYSESESGQLEHEMVRKMAGLAIRTENCGNGYILVGEQDNEVRVAWQISNQIFANIDFSFDREMVAAYIDRLGCITTKDFKVSLDQWVEDEIRWRMKQLDFWWAWRFKRDIKGKGSFIDHLVGYFPDFARRFDVLKEEPSHLEFWKYLDAARKFLWANRHNFKYQASAGWFVLKDKDLYDAEHPPELPEDLRGPPKPGEKNSEKPAPAPETPNPPETPKAP